MNADNLDLRLLRFRSRRDEYPHALASALLEAGRIPEALEVVQVGLSQSENDGALLVLEGRVWFEQGDLPQAQAALLRAAKVTPRDKEPYRWLAQVLMKRGEPARAVQVLERALQLDPTDRALQQAHMRAQRLSKIASEADHPGGPILSPSRPAPPPPQAALPAARRPAERGRPGAGLPPAAGAGLPAPPKAALPPAPGRAAAPRASVPLPPAPRVVTDPQALAQPAAPRRAAQAQRQASARDPVSDSAPPLELSRPRAPGHEGIDDEPTLATELPEELRTWLDAERSSQEPVLSLATSSNDNHKQKRARRRVPVPPWEGDDDYEPGVDDSEPTMAVHSAELRLAALDDSVPDGVIIGESLIDEPTQRAQLHEEAAPVAEPEQPEQVLAMLRVQGIFETAPGSKDTTTWVPKGEAPRSGSRIGGLLALAWLLALSGAGGAYYGFMRWLDGRRGDARSLIERAAVESRDGQYESLLAAERHLTEARSLDPKSSAALEALVFVHATRALEAASGEMGYLRNTLARAKEKAIDPALLGATEALLAAYEGDVQGARAKAEAALSAGGDDARVLFLVGRLYQRAGLPEAGGVLERAIAQDAAFGLAWLARGEIALEDGKVDLAREAFAKARGEDGRELRAELWTIVVDTDAERAPELKRELKALDQRIERGSASDKLLAVSARAGLGLALGDKHGAREAVREGAKLHGVRAPELTALFAERALAVGELELAYRAASSTLRAAPGVRRYRDTLVNVLLRRGDGRGALSLLEGAQDDGPALHVARARGALLVGAREALEGAKHALAAHRATPAGKDDPEVAALLMRVDLRLGASPESLLPAARALAQRAAGASQAQAGAAQIALAEVAVQARQGPAALAALERARALSPDDADVEYLTGRAQRLIGKFDAARESLKRALAIAPSHPEAREVFAGLLLDAGDYAGAYELFSGLGRDGAGLSAELGAAEAQLYNGELSAAEKRYERLEPDDKGRPGAQVLLAQLRLAQGKPGEAAKALEPLTREDGETRTADVLVLYGDALFAEERVDAAAGAYDAALELDPNHPEALVGRALSALRAEKTSQASELATKAEGALIVRLRPPRVHARLLLAQAKIAMLGQDLELARDKLSKAVLLQGVSPEAHFWLAEMRAKTKAPGAPAEYAKYLELEPNGYFAGRAKKALTPR